MNKEETKMKIAFTNEKYTESKHIPATRHDIMESIFEWMQGRNLMNNDGYPVTPRDMDIRYHSWCEKLEEDMYLVTLCHIPIALVYDITDHDKKILNIID